MAVNWIRIPKKALVDALRNTSLGPTNLSRQDKDDLVDIAEAALRTDKREQLIGNIELEVFVMKGEDAVAAIYCNK